MLIVEKIGGTSMARFDVVLDNILLPKKARVAYDRIVVVSAYAGVTNDLLEHKRSKSAGIYQLFAEGKPYVGKLDRLLARLKRINGGLQSFGLGLAEANVFAEERVEHAKATLGRLEEAMTSGYVVRDNVLQAAREVLASVGEAHSAFNTANLLRNRGLNTQFMDLSGLRDKRPLTIDERIRENLNACDPSKTLPIATGYARGVEGIMREFKRGYSEVTFSKIAVAAKATEAIVYKEFHLSSADPKLVGEANSIPVGRTNFNVLDQLADLGLEVLHPKASKPLELAGIPLRLRNTFDAAHKGSLITNAYVNDKAEVELISGARNVVLIEIHDALMVGEVGFDHGILNLFKAHGKSYIVKATSANSITHVLFERDVSEDSAFLDELKAHYSDLKTKRASIVCVIGSKIGTTEILHAATKSLAAEGIPIYVLSKSFRQVNLQFVVPRAYYELAIRSLNRDLCVGRRSSIGVA